MKITPALAGFLKGIFTVAVIAIVSYLADSAHLTGIVNPVIATVAAGLFSSLESYLKSKSDNTTALFGAVHLN